MIKALFFLFIINVFVTNAQTHDYAKAQYLSTYFLGGQRCGATDSWLHGACHTTDGQSVGKDLSGGWHDCGDHIKFHVTSSYTALAYLYGYDKFPEVYPDQYSQAFSAPPSNGIPDILDEVKIQTDYLIKCVDGTTIYWEIGGSEDHNSFKEPVSNSQENLYNGSHIRPVRSAVDGHSNAFGDAAAALALMSIKYASYDNAYAQNCLTTAEVYYNAAKTNPSATADYASFAYSFMSNAEIKDNLGLAAIMLYRATNDSIYLNDAINYASTLSAYDSFSYYSLNALLFFELYKITNDSTYLTKIKNLVEYIYIANNQSCGYYHFTNWGSLRDAGCAALVAALYHLETQDQNAYDFAKSNIDFILGSHSEISSDAPANMSFLIGYDELNGGYPNYPHHAAAFGKTTNDWALFTQESNNPGSVPYAYELKGGLAGGPESPCADFTDNISNYVSSEYCSYYNAAFTGAVAYINKIENNVLSVTDLSKTNENIILYPNPFKDKLIIELTEQKRPKSIEVLNILGEIVSKSKNTNILNLEHLKSGTFIVKIITHEQNIYFKKLIKK